MNKRLFGKVIFLPALIGLMFVISRAWDDHLHTEEDLRRPNDFGSYSGYGYYKINPETILVSLNNGNTDVFQPLLVDPNEIEEDVTDMSISWTQTDFMRIFSALSKVVWDDSMDPDVWSIYDIDFSGGCEKDICDLDFAQIVYFKESENSYTTRIMDIQPYFGLVRWGDGASYSQPIIHKWKSVDLAMSRITAEDALKISEKNGGRETRMKVSEHCVVFIGSSRFNHTNWAISYVAINPSLHNKYTVDLNTGESKVLTVNQ